MQNKSTRRNVIPSTALTTGTKTSGVETNTWGRGIRLYVTISAVTAGGGTDQILLCAQVPGTSTVIPLAGVSGTNILATAGTYVVDFYPGAWLPDSYAAANLLGALGIELPLNWAVRLILGTGDAATIVVDAEILP